MKLVKEIKSKDGELHFRRFLLFGTPWFSVYIHHIYKKDEDKHLHDHPWNYFSMVLKGSYNESSQDGVRLMKPGNLVFASAERLHKIAFLRTNKVVTLFITGKRKRDWGYKVGDEWVDHKTYRERKNFPYVSLTDGERFKICRKHFDGSVMQIENTDGSSLTINASFLNQMIDSGSYKYEPIED